MSSKKKPKQISIEELNENVPIQEQQQTATLKEIASSLSENIISGVADALSVVGGLLDIQSSSNNTDEAEYRRQQALKEKKKHVKCKGIRR